MKKTAVFLVFVLLMTLFALSSCGDDSLEFTSNGDGTCYVAGIGTCKGPEIVIPSTSPDGDTVVGIGYAAFARCSEITSISIPDTIQYVGQSAFAQCTSLNFNVYEDANYLGNENNPYLILIKATEDKETYTIHENTKFIYSGAFANKTVLKSITVPSKVISIGAAVFSNCSALEEVVLPEGVIELGENAFYHCDALVNLRIPDSLEIVGNDTFAWCGNLNQTEYHGMHYIGNENNPYLVLMWADSEKISENCVLHPDTKFIDDGAFSSCYALTSISIPASLLRVGDYAFDSCSNLTDVYYGGSETDWASVTIEEANYPLTDGNFHYNHN